MQVEETKIGNIDIQEISLYTSIVEGKAKNLIQTKAPKCITPLPQLKLQNDSPDASFISVRRLKKYAVMSEEDREDIKKVLDEYEEYKKQLNKKRENFFVIQKDEDELEKEFILQMEIYEERKKNMSTTNSMYEI